MTRRSGGPIRAVVIAVVAGGIGFIGFNLGAQIPASGLRLVVVTAAGLTLLAAIGLGPAAVYLRARGGTAGRPIAASVGLAIIPPLLWYGKEIVRMSEYLSGWLLAYGALHQVQLSLWAWVAATLGAAEIIHRRRLLGSFGPLAAVVLGIAGIALLVLVNGGVTFAQWYMALYVMLFR